MRHRDVVFDVVMLLISALAVAANTLALGHNLRLLPGDPAYRALLITLELAMIPLMSNLAWRSWCRLRTQWWIHHERGEEERG